MSATLLGRISRGRPAFWTYLERGRSSREITDLRGIVKEKLENLAPDRIHLSGLSFFGHHGVLPEEKTLGQRFEVDATLYCDLQSAGRYDDLNATTSYATVFRQIQRVAEGRSGSGSSQLIEKVAEDIAAEVLHHNPLVGGVCIAVRKPHVALPGHFNAMGVEIRRVRSP